MTRVEEVAKKYAVLDPLLNERQRRLWAAAEAAAVGRGGISAVSAATGMSRSTIRVGIQEISRGVESSRGPARVRRPGAGRKRLEQTDPGLLPALEALVDPATRGDPMSPLRWTSKSVRHLAEEMTQQGHPVSPQKVCELLDKAGYSLQGTRKTREGTSHPDRNAQFEHINAQAKRFQRHGQPVISVDTKKKESIGNFANAGREWQPKGEPEHVASHDFPDEELGKAIPYGVYDIGRNEGWVNVGIDHDTAEFAVESIRRWWRTMGSKVYPGAAELLITADAGGSNASRSRAWKVELQRLADDTGLAIHVCHFPPGTSKWNKIEHRMFCLITQNWRGRPLLSVQTVVNLIADTTTATGLRIKSKLDARSYPTGIKIRDDQLDAISIRRSRFHGDWNYTISARASDE
jgi:transposase